MQRDAALMLFGKYTYGVMGVMGSSNTLDQIGSFTSNKSEECFAFCQITFGLVHVYDNFLRKSESVTTDKDVSYKGAYRAT